MIKGTLLIFLFLIYAISAFGEQMAFFKKHDTIWEILTTDKRFTELIAQIEENNLTSVYKNLDMETVFAATDDAFSSSMARRKVPREQLLYHITTVAAASDELWDGRVMDTHAYTDKIQQRLKVLKDSDDFSISTGVHQVKVAEANIEASNGVIHVIEDLLPLPEYLDQTLYESDDTNAFYHACKKADLLSDLKHTQKATIFLAKGDDIFGEGIPTYEKRYLLEHAEGRKDLRRLLRHQMATDMFYSFEFEEGDSTIRTVDGTEELQIHVKNKKGAPSEITVNGIPVIQTDIIAANGVIHVLEKPLLPNHRQDFYKMTPRKVLLGLNSTRFVELVDEMGLSGYLKEDENRTLLAAPSSDDDDSLPVGKKQVKNWLKYHMIRGRYEPEQLEDRALLETETHDNLGEGEYQHVDVHVYENNHGKSIQFGRSVVMDKPIYMHDHVIIYPVQRALTLPRSPRNELSTHLDLSTFLASLYASNADKALEDAHGVSVFAPTNDAFNRLGLLAKHLLHPDSQEDLQHVVLYHVVRGVFYNQLMKEGEYRRDTLLPTDDTLDLNKTKQGLFVRGHGATDGNDRFVLGRVINNSDTLMSNGALHTIDRVQLPASLHVNNRQLMSVEGTHNLFLQLIQENMKEMAKKVLNDLDPKAPYTILAPSDNAFNRFTADLADLMDDKERLKELIKLHIIPGKLPRLSLEDDDLPFVGEEFPTLLDSRHIVIERGMHGGYSVRVKDSSRFSQKQVDAEIGQMGRNTAGGGVIMIDRVLVPKEKIKPMHFSWWTIFLMALGGVVILINALILGFMCWRWYKGYTNGGYIRLTGEN